jgi:hypothetical protein
MAPGWPEDNPWGDRQLPLDDAAFAALLAAGRHLRRCARHAIRILQPGLHDLGARRGAAWPGCHFSTLCGYTHLAAARDDEPAAGMPTRRTRSKLARGYRLVDDGCHRRRRAGLCAFRQATQRRLARLYASVEDMARWGGLLLWTPGPRALATRGPCCGAVRGARCSAAPTFACRCEAVNASARRCAHEAGGYGYGLFAWLSSDLGRIVGHAGGLPGFGSHMLWLPDHDLGVVTLANLTYAPAVPIAVQILRSLITTAGIDAAPGANRRRAGSGAGAASPACSNTWDDALADELFAANFFLDDAAYTQWQTRSWASCARGTARCARPAPSRRATRCVGRGRCRASSGWCRVGLTLAPTVPPRVQHSEHCESIFPAQRGAAELRSTRCWPRPLHRHSARVCASLCRGQRPPAPSSSSCAPSTCSTARARWRRSWAATGSGVRWRASRARAARWRWRSSAKPRASAS